MRLLVRGLSFWRVSALLTLILLLIVSARPCRKRELQSTQLRLFTSTRVIES